MKVGLFNVPVGWKLLNIRLGKALGLDLAKSLREAEEGLVVFCLCHIIGSQLWVEAGVGEHREDIEEEARAIGGGVSGQLTRRPRQLEGGHAHVARGQQTRGGGASPPPVVSEAAAPVVVAAVARSVPVDVGPLAPRMMMVETPAVIVTSLHMEMTRPSHVVTASTEARLEMRLEMIGGRGVEEAGAHQHPVVVLRLMEVHIRHPLLVQVSRHRGWYRGSRAAWELDHARAGLTRAPVAAGQSGGELAPRVRLDGARGSGEEGWLEPGGRGDHAAVGGQTGPMVGDGGAVVTPGEEEAGSGAGRPGGRGAG